jgi:hypothetical protein
MKIPFIRARECDNCGKINPPIFNNNKRLCASCATPDGCYKNDERTLGANGKLRPVCLQIPFKWIGWWS